MSEISFGRRHRFRNSKVGEQHSTLWRKQNVSWLHIAMNEVSIMCFIQRSGD